MLKKILRCKIHRWKSAFDFPPLLGFCSNNEFSVHYTTTSFKQSTYLSKIPAATSVNCLTPQSFPFYNFWIFFGNLENSSSSTKSIFVVMEDFCSYRSKIYCRSPRLGGCDIYGWNWWVVRWIYRHWGSLWVLRYSLLFSMRKVRDWSGIRNLGFKSCQGCHRGMKLVLCSSSGINFYIILTTLGIYRT